MSAVAGKAAPGKLPESPRVEAKVSVVPARRTATYGVKLNGNKRDDLVARVNAKTVVISGGIGEYSNTPPTLPKTIAAVDLALDLLVAVRNELVEQGVTE